MISSLLKITGISIAMAMLSLLLYMTFNKAYYLSLSFPLAAWPEDQSVNFSSVLGNPSFKRRVTRMKDRDLDLYLSTMMTEKQAARLDHMPLEDEQNLFLKELATRVIFVSNEQQVSLRINVGKHKRWENYFKVAFEKHLVLSEGYNSENLANTIEWKTDYPKLIIILINSFLASMVVAGIILIAKKRSKR